MVNTAIRFPGTAAFGGLHRVWIDTGDARGPLASVWMEDEMRAFFELHAEAASQAGAPHPLSEALLCA